MVVDDSALFRLMMRNVLQSIPGCQVVGKATNGRDALEVIEKEQPDLITLDVQMPEMDGIQTLRELKRRRVKARALMVSRLTDEGATATTDALFEGAFDFILKPSGQSPEQNQANLRAALEEKITAFRESLHTKPHAAQAEPPGIPDDASTDDDTRETSRINAVVIGTSTGGPDALKRVLPGLSRDLAVPVIVIQHMPVGYTSSLAERLDEISPIKVREAANGDEPKPGTVLIAPGGRQLKFAVSAAGRVTVELTDDPPEHGCRPSVDYALRSAVEAFNGRLLAVILTGMGRDGTDGCCLVRDQGGRVIAQHAAGCVVYGMPKAVIDNDLANRVTRLEAIAATVNRDVRAGAK